jgi:hypothetical protein
MLLPLTEGSVKLDEGAILDPVKIRSLKSNALVLVVISTCTASVSLLNTSL